MIVGRLIPAGTGLAHHDKRRRKHDDLSTAELEVLGGMGRGNRSEDFADTLCPLPAPA